MLFVVQGVLDLTLQATLMNEINKVKLLQKNSAQNDVRKLEEYNINWEKAHETIWI